MKRRASRNAESDAPSNEIMGEPLVHEARADLAQEDAGVADRAESAQSVPSADDNAPIEGERGIPSINRRHSLQSRLNSFVAMGLMLALGIGLLAWYYHRVMSQPAQARERAVGAVRTKAQGDTALPPLGPIETASRANVRLGEQLLGPAPPLPEEEQSYEWPSGASEVTPAAPASQHTDRRLAGLVFAKTSEGVVAARPDSAGPHIYVSPEPQPAGLSQTSGSPSQAGAGSPSGGTDLAARLRPTMTPAVSARVLPTQRLLLPKGAFIDCTLETAIDSSLPGMTTCVLATDSFSADGKVVLLERGTKLVGETSGQVPQGGSRVFVVWTQARTPIGVVVPLESPGTDELGRAGLAGHVNRHFWQRFGAAILVSVIDGAVQAATHSASDGGDAVTVNPSGSQTVMTEVLKSTINTAPTVLKHHGDRLQVLVARDLDFRSVYELRPTAGH
jgi:type IV secretion system protein VirB10